MLFVTLFYLIANDCYCISFQRHCKLSLYYNRQGQTKVYFSLFYENEDFKTGGCAIKEYLRYFFNDRIN